MLGNKEFELDSSEFKKTLVRKNNLITAKFDLTAIQYKVILYAIHKMQLTNKTFISIEEFRQDILATNSKNYKTVMIDTLEQLMMKGLLINTKDGNLTRWQRFNWLSMYETIYEEQGKRNLFRGCTIKIDDELMPFLSGLRADFTIVYLTEAFNLKSFYSMRLFELILRFKDFGKCEFSVQNYKELMGIDKDEYTDYKILKRSVIKKSLDEINKLKSVNISLEEVKEGRSVKKLRFKFNIDVNVTEDLNGNESVILIENDEIIEKIEYEEDYAKVINSNNVKTTLEELNIPDIVIFTDSAKSLFLKEFKNYNFSDKEYEEIILTAWENITQRDKVNKISMRQYKYFVNEIRNRESDSAMRLSREGIVSEDWKTLKVKSV